MKKRFLSSALLTLACVLGLSAQQQKPINLDLWPNGLPNTNGIEQQGYDDSKNNYKPSITVYLPESDSPTRAVVICPGGAYFMLAMDNEGHNWKNFFNNQGIAAIVLKYRMPHGHDDVPQSDAYEAIRTVKQHAKEWNINPDDIGIMGFSAGGHLASTVATHAADDVRPAFQVLWYPVISMDPAITHMGSHDNLIGEKPSAEMQKKYSNELQVSDKTPRAFLMLADDDDVVNPLNSTRYYEALKAHDIPATMHIHPSGGHGFGIGEWFKYHAEMLIELQSWLQSF